MAPSAGDLLLVRYRAFGELWQKAGFEAPRESMREVVELIDGKAAAMIPPIAGEDLAVRAFAEYQAYRGTCSAGMMPAPAPYGFVKNWERIAERVDGRGPKAQTRNVAPTGQLPIAQSLDFTPKSPKGNP